MATVVVQADNRSISGEERDIRVEDYLNDKLQTCEDLENLDALLSTVKSQHDVLTKQLQEAELSLDKAHKASKGHAVSMLQQAEAFQAQQADIDRRMLIVTRSETSDEAVQTFGKSVEKLRSLDIAKGYVELLKDVDELSEEARRTIRTAPRTALKSYVRLQNLSKALQALQPAAEGAAPHLIDHVEQASRMLWNQMKSMLIEEFEILLDRIKWPGKDARISGANRNDWNEGIRKLLILQEPDLVVHEKAEDSPDEPEPLVLLPLEAMAKPLELRFRYHFDGDRPTNRADKPEYFMSHVTNLLNTYSGFLTQNLEPLLKSEFAGSNIGLNPVYVDSTSAFITSLLPMLRRKISNLLPQISGQPQLLSHFIHELISFDATLRDEWSYDVGGGKEGWKGLTWEVLVKQDWFGRWLQVEKEFALQRYQTIVTAKDAWGIDYDSVDPGITKPTKSAMRLKDLLETITESYRPLLSFTEKLRFLIDIQVAILDKFHDRLHSALEAYMVLTSSVARAVQGVSKEDQASLAGVGGLERLCRVYGSAEYLEKAMRDWSDDIFFLELWDELQERTRKNTANSPTATAKFQDRASSSFDADHDTGGLFDESASAYQNLRGRTESLIIELLISNMRESLRPYSRISTWSSLPPSSPTPTIPLQTLTPELAPALSQLKSYLNFLASALAPAPLRRIARSLANSLQTYMWDGILMRNTFSTSGAAQFNRDVAAVGEIFEGLVGGVGEGMRKIHEAVWLLSLPLAVDKGAGLSAVEVEKRVFENNERAKEVLEELGVKGLAEQDARSVLERRVELGY